MARYLQKYVKTYRVVANYDRNTNDFPRIIDANGNIALDSSFDDISIICANKILIYHVGGSNLQSYIPSIGRGHNIVQAIHEDIIGGTEELKRDYETIYKNLADNGLIFDIEETDSEILFKFKDKNMESLAKYLKPKTSGASISPFSVKNLPKQKYDIPINDLALYKGTTACIPKGDVRIYLDLNNGFLSTLTTNKSTIEDIKLDMKKVGLKGKEYIHSINEWSNYMEYAKTYLDKYLK